MLIIPAIDLIGGKCVRLTQGDYDQVTNYDREPVDQAQVLKAAGARCLHIVDLDGARAGQPVNLTVVQAIETATGLSVQYGGGLRSVDTAEKALASGADRIILGTSAIENLDLIAGLIAKYGPRRIIVSIDIKDGLVATRGWLTKSTVTLSGLLVTLKKLNVRSLIITDVASDGQLAGPNFDLLRQAVGQGFEITAAGGVTSEQDIAKLSQLGIERCIVGKALYEGRLSLDVFKQYPSENTLTRRVIPCLDVRDGRVVKGTHFTSLRDIGDPVALAKRYCDQGADELTLLDITATREGRSTFIDIIRDVAKSVTIPFTVGGGIRSIEDIRQLLKAGADKVSIGSAAILDQAFVPLAVQEFGSQAIVVSLDVKKISDDWMLFIRGGSDETSAEALSFARQMAADGAGELLINSLDRDGTGTGFDLPLLKTITDAVNVPVIASSGAGKLQDFSDAFEQTAVSAVLAAGVFHSDTITIPDLKQYLASRSIGVRT